MSNSYSDEDIEVLQATAMVIAENLVSGAVAGAGPAIEVSRSQPTVIEGEPLAALAWGAPMFLAGSRPWIWVPGDADARRYVPSQLG